MTEADLRSLLEELRGQCEEHGFRAATLVPDLALVGLVYDAVDAAETSLHLLATSRPHRAFATARICFEACQRVLPLAVRSDYLRLGTRAWVYYRRNVADQRLGPLPELDPVGVQIADIWKQYNPAASSLVEEALRSFAKKPKPDNFLGEDLAKVSEECYRTLAKLRGDELDKDVATVNRKIYAILCRYAHASPRLEPERMNVDHDGFGEVTERFPTVEDTRASVHASLAVALREGSLALRHRLAQRRAADDAARAKVLADLIRRGGLAGIGAAR